MKVKRTETPGLPSSTANMWTTFEIDDMRFTVCKEAAPRRPDATWWGRVSSIETRHEAGAWNTQGVWATTMREVFSGLRGRLGERKARAFSGLDADVKT